MSRKATSEANKGLGDIIGVTLLAIALLLLVAQLSFDRYDLSFFRDPHNKPVHNWIGPLGAYLAWGTFLPLGVAGYLLPWLLAAFGVAYLLNFLGYLRERLNWSLLWSAMLIVSLTGLLYLADDGGLRGKLHEIIGAQSTGGWLGWLTYGQTQERNFGLSLLGPLGATIIYSALCLISLLFLTRNPRRRKPDRNRRKKSPWNAAPATWKNRRSNCRRKSNAPAWAPICSRCRSRPCAT